MNIEDPSQEQSEKSFISPLYVVLGVVIFLALAAGLIWLVIWLAQTRPTEIATVRDVFIIALALETCLFGIVLMLLLIMVIRLVNMLEFEIKPILEQTNETVKTVRGTTDFVSRNVVGPVAKAGGYVAGLRRGLKVLLGNPRNNLPD
jgi:hypothetical protein